MPALARAYPLEGITRQGWGVFGPLPGICGARFARRAAALAAAPYPRVHFRRVFPCLSHVRAAPLGPGRIRGSVPACHVRAHVTPLRFWRSRPRAPALDFYDEGKPAPALADGALEKKP